MWIYMNSDPLSVCAPFPAEADGWMVKMKLSAPAELDGLMDEAAYNKFCEDN